MPSAGRASGLLAEPGRTVTPDEQRGTRNKVARSILDHGPSTAAQLAARLGLTQAAVRRHLDTLVGEEVVEARAQRVYGSRGRGRPARVFALTDDGRDAFDQHYDRLALDALRWIAQSSGGGERGEAAVAAFARARVAAFAETYRPLLARVPPEDRTRALAEALTRDGYAATARGASASTGGAPGPGADGGVPGGEQLCQHHCPVAHAAEQFPQLCEAETEVFSDLLGTHVQRLATIAHGDGVCTTFIPGRRDVPREGGGARHRDPPQTTPPQTKPSQTKPSQTDLQQTTTAPASTTAGRKPA